MDIWDLGDYELVGDWFAAAARSVLQDGAMPDDLSGVSVLDVACGSGAVAIEAARRGASVRAVDNSERMVEIAARRAAEQGLDIIVERGSFEDLSAFDTSSVVTSTIGAMFAADPPAVAAQLAGACSDEGIIGITAWHPDGAFGAPNPGLAELTGPMPVDVTRWSDPEQLDSFFADTGHSVAHHRIGTLLLPFASTDEALALMREHSGPWVAMFGYFESAGLAEQAEYAVRETFGRFTEPLDDGVALRVVYTVSHLTRS